MRGGVVMTGLKSEKLDPVKEWRQQQVGQCVKKPARVILVATSFDETDSSPLN